MTKFQALLANDPLSIYENYDTEMELDELFKHIKITIGRLTRIIAYIGLFSEWKFYLLYHRYERLTYLFMIYGSIIIFFLDFSNLLPFFIIFLI